MNTKTTMEVMADIKDIQSKMATVDKIVDNTANKAVMNTQKMGAGFQAAGKQSAAGTAMMAKGSNQATTAITGLNWMVSDSPYFFQSMRMGIMSVSNNVTPLIQNITYLNKTTGGMKATMKALGGQLMGPMGIVFAITMVIAIVQALSFIMAKNKAKTEGSTEANKEYRKSLEGIGKALDIDMLERQILSGEKQVLLLKNTGKALKEEQAILKAYNTDIKNLKEALHGAIGMNALEDNPYINIPWTEVKAKLKDAKKDLDAFTDQFEKDHPEADIKKYNMSKILAWYESKAKLNEVEIKQEETKNKKRKEQIDADIKIGELSKDELRYKEKLFEIQTARLPLEEQIAAWQQKLSETTGITTKDKEKRLDIDRKLLILAAQKTKLEDEISELKKEELTGDAKIADLRLRINAIDQSSLDGQKEALILQKEIQKVQAETTAAREEAEKKYNLLKSGVDTESRRYLNDKIQQIETELQAVESGTERQKELQTDLYDHKTKLMELENTQKEDQLKMELRYQQQLAGMISDGGMESVYENMLSNIKQKVIEYWLQKLGITQAMMNMEKMIIMLGEGNIQGIRDIFHAKQMGQKAAETGASATAAGVKATESAAGIPFPGNIAAIGLALASVFSALRKSKTTGSQIVAAVHGAVIDRPTLVLAGEAMSQSGTELVTPTKTFKQYMDEKIMPSIMAKVNVDNSGLRADLQQVKSAINSLGDKLPGRISKSLRRFSRGNL